MSPQPPQAILVLEDSVLVTQHDLNALEDILGRPVFAREVEHRRSDLSWMALVALPLTAFIQTFGEEAAKGLIETLRAILRRRPSRASAEAGAVALRDTETTTVIVLESGLPTEAYDELRLIDPTAAYTTPLHFNRSTGRWEPRQ